MKSHHRQSMVALGVTLALVSSALGQDKLIPPNPILHLLSLSPEYNSVIDQPTVFIENFGVKAGGWTDNNVYPRFMGDVNGDGRADIVGFGESGVFVAIAMAPDQVRAQTSEFRGNDRFQNGFNAPVLWVPGGYTKPSGWNSQENYPRMLADVNGDRRADIVGFAHDGVSVSLSTGTGFGSATKWLPGAFSAKEGWSSFDSYPRMMGDVNGDGKADIVGFGIQGTYVSLSTGSSFGPGTVWIKNYSSNAGGWTSWDKLPRHLADVNGDGRADIVGFGHQGVYVSRSSGSSFAEPVLWNSGFVDANGGWTSQTQFPRFVVDVNKDGKADIVGFGQDAVAVALSDGSSFTSAALWSERFINSAGWTDNLQTPRLLADVRGDGMPALVGFSSEGVRIAFNIEGKFWELGYTATDSSAPPNTYCWKDTYARPVGVVGNSCPNGYEAQGGGFRTDEVSMCYPVCPAGMKGVGPMCWQMCPAGYSDIGVSCAKPQATSSAGYGWQIGDAAFDFDTGPRARCEQTYGAGKCYKSGLIWYPSCPAGFHKVGDLVCSPDCPAGMRDDGAYCAKATTNRGAGILPTCPSGLVSEAGLCYQACNAAYEGGGATCWSKCNGTFPEPCAAGCATSKASCAGNIGMMTSSTLGAVASLASFAVGGPGISEAGKLAMKAAQSSARKWVATGSRILPYVQTTDKAKYAWNFAKVFTKTYAYNKINDPRNLFFNGLSVSKTLSLSILNMAARDNSQLEVEGLPNFNTAMSLLSVADITGVTSAILAFSKYPSCGVEQIAASKTEVDFGNIGVNESAQTITITANKPTTFKHVGTPAYSNCSIVPTGTCVGRTLQPGQTCTVSASLKTGGANLLGELRIYTDQLDSYPLPIKVTANTGAAAQCNVVANVDEAGNQTNLAGAWQVGSDYRMKVTISPDGVIADASGSGFANGKITVKDSTQRTYDWDFRGAKVVMTLDPTNQTLLNASGVAVVTRRPWHPRCGPGQTLIPDSNLAYTGGTDFNGPQCYDVPPDYEAHYMPGTVGLMSRPTTVIFSKPCPAGFDSDASGLNCLPRWTGRYVWAQTGDGDLNPALVTSCPMQVCPVNYTKTAACTCQANIQRNPNTISALGTGTPPLR